MAGLIEQYHRDENFRRMDGDLSDKITVYYYPSDLETAYDSGHLIEFTVFHKSTDGVKEKLDDLKARGGEGSASLSDMKTAALKEIEADTKDGQGIGRWDTTIKKGEADARRRLVDEIFGTIQSDPNAYDENGNLITEYANVVALAQIDIDQFTRGTQKLQDSLSYVKAVAAGNMKTTQVKTDKTSRLAAGGLVATGETVRLYLPGGLNFADEVSYKGTNLGLLKGLLEMNVGLAATKALSATASAVDQGLGFMGMEVNSAEAIQAISGAVENSRTEQLFEGQSIRTFDFSFVFRPRNKNEAKMMRDIVKLFRFHMRPELGPGSGYLLTPSEFKIEFFTLGIWTGTSDEMKEGVIAHGGLRPDGDRATVRPNTFLPKIKNCACTSVTMNVNPDEIMETFDDPNHQDTPISLQLDLSFTEKEEIVRQDIRKGY